MLTILFKSFSYDFVGGFSIDPGLTVFVTLMLAGSVSTLSI